jgi:hypothetical protein
MRTIYEIAEEIKSDWKNPSNKYAALYLDKMLSLKSIEDYCGNDPASFVITEFLENAKYYRGENARRLKNELKMLLPKKKIRKSIYAPQYCSSW